MPRAEKPAEPPQDLVLTDPRAIRALAHEARLAIIDELTLPGTVELTASELAERVGLSPSALSYHLRVLERFGIVRRADPRPDGRERPWVRTADGISVRTSGSVAGEAAQSLVLHQVLDAVHERWDAWARAEPSEPADWRDAGALHRTRIWVTAAELVAITEALDAVVAPYQRDRRAVDDRPAGSKEIDVLLSLVPRPGG